MASTRPSDRPAAVGPKTPQPGDVHRRETWLHIVLPMAGGGAIIVILVILALLLPLRAQVSLIADLLSLLVLCPLATCLFPIYVLMMVVAFGMNRVHDGAARPLRQVSDLSRGLADRTISLSEAASQVSIRLIASVAALDKLWNVFDRPKDVDEERHDTTGKE